MKRNKEMLNFRVFIRFYDPFLVQWAHVNVAPEFFFKNTYNFFNF